MKLSATIAGVVIIFLLTWNPVTLAQQNAQIGFIFPFYATGTVFPNPLNALDFRTILYVTNPGALETKATFDYFDPRAATSEKCDGFVPSGSNDHRIDAHNEHGRSSRRARTAAG